jgi:hypothetical protein
MAGQEATRFSGKPEDFQGIVIDASEAHLAFEMWVSKIMSYFPKLAPTSSELTTGP